MGSGSLSGCAGRAPLHRDPTILVQHLNNSSVALVGVTTSGSIEVYCTGVWVNEDTLVTAAHCIRIAVLADLKKPARDEDGDVVIGDLTGQRVFYIVEGEVEEVGKDPNAMHSSRAVAIDLDHDLAILKASGKVIPPHEYAQLAKTTPGIGETVHIVGQVKRLYWSYVTGVVSAYRSSLPENRTPNGEVGPFIQISAPVYYGNSGGGAFNNEGELIGIANFLGGAPNTSMFAHVDSVRELLKSL